MAERRETSCAYVVLVREGLKISLTLRTLASPSFHYGIETYNGESSLGLSAPPLMSSRVLQLG